MTVARPAPPARRRRTTPTVYLVRHAKAENRDRWEAPDSERPLTTRGLEQSRVIASHLADLGGRQPSRVLSSPARRCHQTVEPLAAASKLEVVQAEWLDEGSDSEYAFEQLRKLAARFDPPSGLGGPVAACTHGDVIWGVLDSLHRLGVDLGPRPEAPKGGVWIIAATGPKLSTAAFYQPDEARKARS
ncbi:MAG: SixA phosphatase family protein [Acidimicrobiales bacterium]|jgi:8-oxo-dGTP diphosphatase